MKLEDRLQGLTLVGEEDENLDFSEEIDGSLLNAMHNTWSAKTP